MTNDEVKAERERLDRIVMDWESDGSHPANYIRRTALGREIARVDRWCGGYQKPHEPVTIGYRVQVSTRVEENVVLVSDYADVDKAIEAAKRAADTALPKVARAGGRAVVTVINSLALDETAAAFSL